MAETATTIVDLESELASRNTNAEENVQPVRQFMTHSYTPQNFHPTITLGLNFNPMEDSRRIITNNFSTTIEDINPLINFSRSRPALTFQEWLNPNYQREIETETQISQHSDSVIINVEENLSTTAVDIHEPTSNNLEHDIFTSAGNHNNNNNNSESNSSQSLTLNAEERAIHKSLENYIPFLTIWFSKSMYDNGAEILNFVLLVFTFIQANNDLKREILKQQNCSRMELLRILCYIIGCFTFINFVFKQPIFFSYNPPITISQLFWTVVETDYILKLITVGIKVLMTCLPVKLFPFKKRGKYYFMVETTSQLYRSGAPLKPWLHYLYLIYDSSDKVLGILLSTIYVIHKIGDLTSNIKKFFGAGWKMLQNVNLGISPSKEQIIASGGVCAICHEEYSIPVKLYCKHIFCESCITTWLDRERSCPLCRASITDDPSYRDGHTTHFIQLY